MVLWMWAEPAAAHYHLKIKEQGSDVQNSSSKESQSLFVCLFTSHMPLQITADRWKQSMTSWQRDVQAQWLCGRESTSLVLQILHQKRRVMNCYTLISCVNDTRKHRTVTVLIRMQRRLWSSTSIIPEHTVTSLSCSSWSDGTSAWSGHTSPPNTLWTEEQPLKQQRKALPIWKKQKKKERITVWILCESYNVQYMVMDSWTRGCS